MSGSIKLVVAGVIGVTIINAVRVGADTANWSATEISLTALFGLLVIAGIMMEMIGRFGK